jgi:hypothetical protein
MHEVMLLKLLQLDKCDIFNAKNRKLTEGNLLIFIIHHFSLKMVSGSDVDSGRVNLLFKSLKRIGHVFETCLEKGFCEEVDIIADVF